MKRSRLFYPGFLSVSLMLGALPAQADPVIRAGSSISPVDIQLLLDLFEMDLGTSFTTVNWDSVPDENASPNPLPPDYFTTADPIGLNLSTPGTSLLVSADASNPTGTASGFADIDPSYEGLFQAFSAERLFAAAGSTELGVSFSDNANQPGTVTGFGAVFAGVDQIDSTYIEFFDTDNNSLTTVFVPPAPAGGLSFLGVSFNAGETVGSVVINSGNTPLGNGVTESGSIDLVALDDLVFSSPVPEPSTWALIAIGTLTLLAAHRRR